MLLAGSQPLSAFSRHFQTSSRSDFCFWKVLRALLAFVRVQMPSSLPPGCRGSPRSGVARSWLRGGAWREAEPRRVPCVYVNVSVLHSSIVCRLRRRRRRFLRRPRRRQEPPGLARRRYLLGQVSSSSASGDWKGSVAAARDGVVLLGAAGRQRVPGPRPHFLPREPPRAARRAPEPRAGRRAARPAVAGARGPARG